MFSKSDYVIDKILLKLQSKFDIETVQKCKFLLKTIPNLDMVNFKGDTFEDSSVGWLTASKILDKIISNNKEISIQNFQEYYFQEQNSKGITRKEDIIDPSLFRVKGDENVVNRILEEHGEISLLEDIEISDLTENGLRERGLIDKNYSFLDGEDYNIEDVDDIPVVTVVMGQIIYSPYTGSDNIFQINSDTFLDLDSDKEFKIKIIDDED